MNPIAKTYLGINLIFILLNLAGVFVGASLSVSAQGAIDFVKYFNVPYLLPLDSMVGKKGVAPVSWLLGTLQFIALATFFASAARSRKNMAINSIGVIAVVVYALLFILLSLLYGLRS